MTEITFYVLFTQLSHVNSIKIDRNLGILILLNMAPSSKIGLGAVFRGNTVIIFNRKIKYLQKY